MRARIIIVGSIIGATCLVVQPALASSNHSEKPAPYFDHPEFSRSNRVENHQNISHHPRREDVLDFILMASEDSESLKRKKEYYKSLSPEEKARLRKAKREFEGLSESDRKRVKDRWKNMSDEEKARYKKWKKNNN